MFLLSKNTTFRKVIFCHGESENVPSYSIAVRVIPKNLPKPWEFVPFLEKCLALEGKSQKSAPKQWKTNVSELVDLKFDSENNKSMEP